MKEKRLTREGKIVAAGVCLVILAMAAYLGFRVYQARHYRLPFDADSVESVVLYQQSCAHQKKKEIDSREDITQMTALINGMHIRGSYDYNHGAPSGGTAAYLSFRTSDGGEFNCLLTDWQSDSNRITSSIFTDGDRRFEIDGIDLRALWDEMDYKEQEAFAQEEIDTYGLTIRPPELLPISS